MPKSEIYNKDCIELMATLPDKSIDLAVVDPPYGIDINSSGRLVKEKGRAYKEWDKLPPRFVFHGIVQGQQKCHHLGRKPLHRPHPYQLKMLACMG